MHIDRIIIDRIVDKLKTTNKIALIYGARQVGKTTLAKAILQSLNMNFISINADEKRYIDILSSRNLSKFKLLLEGYDVLFIDEAQRIPDVGVNLKIIHDHFPKLKLLVTGSSSFDLSNITKEPLTGRTWTHTLYPISYMELRKRENPVILDDKLEELLIYGSYPEIFSIQNSHDKRKYLQELSSSYLYKDILEISSIKHSNKIHNLLKLIAFQIGSQVSISELAQQLEMNKETVNNYIDLLEKSFVLFRLSGFSRNLRKEVTKMDKIYFYDLGVRNSIIENFNILTSRDDIGALWENFLIIERIKFNDYNNHFTNSYFWRTYSGSELDFIEENSGKLTGYEFKYSSRKKAKVPKLWIETYKNSTFQVVNRENYFNFIS